MVNNSYLESYKIQVVRRMLSGEHLNVVSQELGIAKSTLWGWKCKYAPIEKKKEKKNRVSLPT